MTLAAARLPIRPLIAGNWKMHGLHAQLTQIRAVARSVRQNRYDAAMEVRVPVTLTADGLLRIGGASLLAAYFTAILDVTRVAA